MNENTLVTPDQKTYDMSLVHEAEARVHEIAIVTPTKAPELMALFSRACFVLGRHLAAIHLGSQRAQKETANRRAVMIIDVIPEKMAERKMTSNETVRQAFLDLDPDYSAALDREAEFEASLLLIKRKITDMEGALNAVKKVLQETEGMYRRPNYNANNTSMDEAVSSLTTTETGLKIGKPRY